MSNSYQQDPSQIHNELSLRVYDTRAMLTAIEAMAFDASGKNRSPHETLGDIHSLITIALEKAREAVELSDQLETSFIATGSGGISSETE